MKAKNLFDRRILVLLFIFTISLTTLIGQVPNGMKYQAVVRDSWGRIIENKTVGVEIKILQFTDDGQSVFVEEHQKTTNEYGLIYLVIGSENQVEFTNIDWSNGPYFIEIGIDIDGGHAYELYGTSELLSVPYALYALHAQTAENGADTLIVNVEGGFIANVVVDYQATGDGSTNDTEAFEKAFSENTDVFVPSSDNTYIVSNLNIPDNKRIWFERGATLEIFGSITGNKTEIIAGDYQIFTPDSQVDGTWKSGIAYDSWFGNNQQIPGMAAMVTSADTTRWGMQVPVLDSAYSEAWDESLEVPTRNAIYDKIQSLEISGGSSFIANVVDDYAAVGDGATDNAQAFSNAFNENNDVFVPFSENNYLISNLNIPNGKRLWFERGAIIHASGNLSGDTTEIIAGDYQIFTSSSNLSGSWKSGIAYDSWFGNDQEIQGMKAMVTSADTTRWGTQIPVLDSAYSQAWDESMEVPTRNAIYDKIQSLEISGGSSFIANVVEDYAAVGDGATDNAQAFSNAFSENNDVFVPYADETFIISNLNIPDGKRIWFERGAVIDVTGSLSGDTTEIMAGDYQIFTSSSNLSGTWKGGIAYDSWFGNNQQIPGMKAMVTSADTTRWGTQIPVLDSAYSQSWDESLEVPTRNAIYDKIQSLEISGGSSFIANVVDDYAAVGDGETDNAQAFLNAFNESHDIFIPTAENPYVISGLTIPSGKRMWFERGALIDVTGTLIGDSTEIIAGEYQLFTSSSNLSGTWKGGIAYNCWSGNNCEIPGMIAMVTSADTARWGIDTYGSGSFIANVVDYGALPDGTNDDTQAFEDALDENNDIFIPGGDSTYSISSLIIPANKRLWFETDAKIDVSGILTGDSTEIMAGDQELFTSTSSLDGTWKGGISYDSWSGKNEQIPGMVSMVSPNDTLRWGIDTYGAGSFIANVIDYGAIGDGTSNDSLAFSQALAENNDIFIPQSSANYNISKLTVPAGKRIWFEGGAVLNVSENLTIEGEIIAGHHKIFTIGSAEHIDASKAIYDKACPEWFGANGFDNIAGDDAKAINAALQVFKVVYFLHNARYRIDETIYPPKGSQIKGNYSMLIPVNSFNETVLYWKKPLCTIEDLNIGIPNYKKRGGNKSNAYTAWVMKHVIDYYSETEGREYRRPFTLRNVTIHEMGPFIPPADWTPDTRYHGFFVSAREKGDAGYDNESYFGDVYNLKVEYGYDTAVYLDSDMSVGDEYNSHTNSWYFQNCKFDYGIRHIVISERSRGHYFGGIMCQTYYSNPSYPYQDHPAIDIASFANRLDVRFEDEENHDSLIVFREGAYKNIINTENYQIQQYVKDENTVGVWRASNQVGNSPFLVTDGLGKIVPFKPLGKWTFNEVEMNGPATYNETADFDVYADLPIMVQRETNSMQNIHTVAKFVSKSSLGNGLNGNGNNFGGQFLFNLAGTTTNVNLGFMKWRKTANSNSGDNKGELIFGVSGTNRLSIDYTGTTTINNVMKLTPRTSAPPNPTEGMIYVNSSNHHVYCYLGGSWKQLD